MRVGLKFRDLEVKFNVLPEYFRDFVEALHIKRVKNCELVRAGKINDGGYILIDNFYRDGIAYSFGICEEVSFDEALANIDYQIFMYDMTIDDLPKHRPEFHFFKEGIGRELDLSQRLDTLEHFIERNGHSNRRNMILKMDVEGAEWDFLETVKSETLAQFDQIVFEFHNLMLASSSIASSGKIISLLKKINQTHQVVHIHANNANTSIIFEDELYPELLEVTYANRASYEFEDAEIVLPNPTVDSPNLPQFSEIILGNWNSRFRKS